MQDLFNENRIRIKGDNYLNAIAQHIYDLYERDKSLTQGESIGEINRKIHLAVMMDSGLSRILSGDNVKENFSEWYLTKQCVTEEETARALRGLTSAGIINLPKNVVLKAEQHKTRIASSQH